jgi:hypothetical protein
MFRGSPAPRPGAEEELRVADKIPKDDEVRVPLGLAKFAWLAILKISARSSVLIRSVIGVRLKNERSTSPKPGP